MDVRVATAADAETVGVLLHDFNAEFDTPTDPPAVLAERFVRLTGPHPERAQLVVLLAGEPGTTPVGIAVLALRPVLYADGPAVMLDELYVRPDLRGRRIGHDLMLAVEDLARERGAVTVEIGVDGVDHDTRRFYEAHGYARFETDQPEPTYFYHRELD